jgi:hypothetical protein
LAFLDEFLVGPLDPATDDRIQDRGNKVTKEIRKKRVTMEIAVELSREIYAFRVWMLPSVGVLPAKNEALF